jgi:undecaprenyl-diphosphatase
MVSGRKRGQPVTNAGSRVDAGPTTQSGPLGRVDPAHPAPSGTVPRPPVAAATGTLIVGFAALIASLVVLGSIANGVRDQEVFVLDTWATPFLHSIASPGLDWLMTAFTTMGSTLVLVPLFVVVGAALLLRRRYGAVLFLGIASAGALVIDATMKLVFQRPRPMLDYATVLPDYSFPSGHAMNGVVIYVALALILWSVFGRRIGIVSVIVAGVLAFAIGVSRIYLGYHYLTDVVGGFLAGIVWLLVVGAAFRARPKLWPWRVVEEASSG